MAHEILGLSESKYHGRSEMSCSKLKAFALSAAHGRHHLDNPPKTTPAMSQGALLHALVLEGDDAANDRFAIKQSGRARAALEANRRMEDEGKTLVTAEQWEHAEGMRDAIFANETAAKFLGRCSTRETSMFFEVDGVQMKARLDACSDDGIIFDLKTTGRPIDQFPRQAFDLGYHIQSAIYGTAYEQVRGKPCEAFVFAVVESTPPHGVAVFLADEAFIEHGRHEFQRLLNRYRECVETGRWSGYPDELRILELPGWVKNREGMEDV